jgi:DNA-binding response OmpR family regulator
VIQFGDLEVDTQTLVLSVQGRQTVAPPRVVGVLACLIRQPAHYLPPSRIMDALNKWDVTANWLCVCVVGVRRILGQQRSITEVRTKTHGGYGIFLRSDRPVGWERSLRLRKNYDALAADPTLEAR